MESDFEGKNENISTISERKHVLRQISIYMFFAGIMIGLNMIIQNLFDFIIFPALEFRFRGNQFLISTIFSRSPYNVPELIGSIIAVGITFIIKFFLDKFVVFQEINSPTNKIERQVFIYFGLAIITTLENIGIQFILGIIVGWSLNVRIIIALSCGYFTKFFLDRKYCFKK